MQEIKRKGKELEPTRKLAYELLALQPLVDAKELQNLLAQRGYIIARGTCQTWVKRFNKQKAKVIQPIKEKLVRTITPAITFEQILKVIPDIETLSLLVFQGMTKRMEEKDNAYETIRQENLRLQRDLSAIKQELEHVTHDRNRMERMLNEAEARGKIGTLTLDQAKRRLIPKR